MIKCEKLSKIYLNGDVETVALKEVSFQIEKGEFVSIIGPSGSGKDRKSTRLNSSHIQKSRMPSSA